MVGVVDGAVNLGSSVVLATAVDCDTTLSLSELDGGGKSQSGEKSNKCSSELHLETMNEDERPREVSREYDQRGEGRCWTDTPSSPLCFYLYILQLR